MAGQTITTVDAILKDFYLDKIVEEIKQQMPLLDYFKKRDDMPTDGRQVYYPVHVGRNTGVGAIGAGATLPTAGRQSWQDLNIPYRYNYGRITIDAQSMKATKTSKGAFEKVFDAEIMGAAKDVGRNRNRQLFGYGKGIIAQVKTGTSGVTQVLKNCQGQTDANGQYNPARFFAAGQGVAFIAANGTLNYVDTISSVSADLTTLTLVAGTGTSNTGDFVVLCPSAVYSTSVLADTGYNNECMGLMGMVDDATYVSTYFNIVRGTYPIMNSSRLSLGGSALTPAIMQKAWDAVYQKSDGKITDCFMHPVTLREHLANLQLFKRYVDEFAMHPDAGFKGAAHEGEIEFNEAPLHVDRDAPYGVIFGIDESVLFRYVNEEGKWADEDGTILLRLTNSDAYEARFRVFDNFCNDAPNRCFVIDQIGLSAAPESIQII